LKHSPVLVLYQIRRWKFDKAGIKKSEGYTSYAPVSELFRMATLRPPLQRHAGVDRETDDNNGYSKSYFADPIENVIIWEGDKFGTETDKVGVTASSYR
jgi:hypothetical protein